MRILWLTGSLLPRGAALLRRSVPLGASWTESLCSDLLREGAHELLAFCRSDSYARASEGAFTIRTFEQPMQRYSERNEALFFEALTAFCPDVIHIFGTEYPHTLAMLRAAERAGLLGRTVVSIQGLCSVIAGHYLLGLPPQIWRRKTLRDVLRGDCLLQQKKAFAARGAFETEALRLARHVAGRTDWDLSCTRRINPALTYHPLGEGMRAPFYAGRWTPGGCARHTLFLPQGDYPVKGMHFALEALALLKRTFPDVRLLTTGQDPRKTGWRRTYYQKYLADRIAALDLAAHVSFLGALDADGMKAQFLSANAVISTSTVENSPNGVAEAMLLGAPVVSSMVGGVASMLTHGQDGFLYPADAPYLLAHYVSLLFGDDALAERLSEGARSRAAKTHDRAAILLQLTEIYGQLAGGDA